MLETRTYQRIADIVGVSQDRVARFVEQTEIGGHLVHGIKSVGSVEGIMKAGVLPMSPDGGVSYWTSGLRIFAANGPDSSLFGLDSSFFDYGSKVLALTNKHLLASHGIHLGDISSRSILIAQPVPRTAIAILGVGGAIFKNGSKAMFELLEDVVHQGYSGGELFRA